MTDVHEIWFPPEKPASEEISALVSRYYDEIADRYDGLTEVSEKRKLYSSALVRETASALRAEARIVRVLSIGIGTGVADVRTREASGLPYEIVGVEPSAGMCAHARGRGLQVVQATWPAPVPPGSFDAVLMLWVFGHVSDQARRREWLRAARTALRPGGILILDVLNMDDVNEWGPQLHSHFRREQLSTRGFELGDCFYRLRGERTYSYFRYFTTTELDSMLRNAQFSPRFEYLGYGARVGERVGPTEGSIYAVARKS